MKDGILIILTALMVSGCAAEPGSNHFLVDTRFEDCHPGLNCEMEVFRHVVDEFRQAFKSPDADITLERTLVVDDFSYDVWEDYDGVNARVFKISFADPAYDELGEEADLEGYYGLSRPGESIALVWEPYTMPDGGIYFAIMERLVMHELGHHIGLHHGDGPMMDNRIDNVHSHVEENPCVDQQAVDTFCAFHQCDGTQKPTCK